MNISVASCIADLLFERDTVILPGFGGFTAEYKSAGIDQVQGLIQPPSKEVQFKTNLVLNDGVLVDFIKTKYSIEAAEAQEQVDDYIQNLRERLAKKEIVQIPDVGKLYLDFEKTIKFLPDKTNFNKESFGLPALNFYPVLRNKEEVIAQTAQSPSARPANQPADTSSKKAARITPHQILPWLIAASVFILGISLYYYYDRYIDKFDETSEEDLASLKERLNIKPSLEDTALLNEPPAAQPETKAEINEAKNIPAEPVPDTEAPTLAPGKKECIIIIGGFSNKTNAEKLVKKLYRDGFEPYSDLKGSLTRVGVQFAFDTESEVNEVLEKVHDRYNSSAWVLKAE